MKNTFSLFLACMLCALLCLGAYAAETVYVTAGGSGENVYTTLTDAVDALDGNGGTVVLTNVILVDTVEIPEQLGDLTLTATGNGRLFLRESLTLAKNENDNTVTFDLPVTASEDAVIFGGFNSVHFTENFAVTGTVDFYGGVETLAGSGIDTRKAAYDTPRNALCITELPYSITVDGGNFGIFAGGNRRPMPADYNCYVGAITAPLTVTINGGSFGAPVPYGVNDAIKGDEAFSLSGQSFLSDDATLVINGGTFHTPIYVHGYIGQTSTTSSAASALTRSDVQYYAADGDVTVTVNGGTFTKDCFEINIAQTASTYNRLHRGNYSVSIADAADLADGIVLDATQVKAYANGDAKAKLTTNKTVDVKRFDVVNGETATYAEPIRIACVGDSITQGSCAYDESGVIDFENLSYPAQMYVKAVDAGDDIIVSNYGCGATRVLPYGGLYYRDGLAYILSVEETDADYIVIGLGTNDSLSVATTVGQHKHFYEQYTDLALSYECLPDTKTVFGTSAIYRYGSDVAAAGVIRALQEQVLTEQKAAGKNVQYIDLYALTLEDALADRLLHTDLLHPNAAGYTIYADAIYNAVFNGVTEVENFELTDLWVSASGTNNAECTKENPTNNIAVAFSKAAPTATIHIVGEYAYNKLATLIDNGESYAFNTPYSVKNLTIVGEGEGAVLSVDTKHFFVNGNLTLDNIRLQNAANVSGALYIAANYNDLTLTDTFSTTGTAGALLIAGHTVYNDNGSWYTTAEHVSSDRDCTITVNGGAFVFILGGNYHMPAFRTAPYGTYSGDMILNIGENVVLGTHTCEGIVGMNYLSGSVTANLGAWNGNAIREFALVTNQSAYADTYDVRKNTGTVTVNTLLDNEIVRAGDINKDGTVDLADALCLLRYMLNGTDASYNKATYYDRTEITLVEVINALKRLAK